MSQPSERARAGGFPRAWPSLYSLARHVASRRTGRDHDPVRSFFILIVVALILFGPTRVHANDADVLATLRPGHPRLLVLDDDIARLKQQIKDDATAKRYFEHVRGGGDKLLDAPA